MYSLRLAPWPWCIFQGLRSPCSKMQGRLASEIIFQQWLQTQTRRHLSAWVVPTKVQHKGFSFYFWEDVMLFCVVVDLRLREAGSGLKGCKPDFPGWTMKQNEIALLPEQCHRRAFEQSCIASGAVHWLQQSAVVALGRSQVGRIQLCESKAGRCWKKKEHVC